MKLAVLYDYLETVGGGERVAFSLARHFDADLITTAFDPGILERAGAESVRVVSLGPLVLGPPLKQIHASYRFRRARLRGYDVYVFVGNWAHFAGRRHHPNVYYCLTPTRAFYDQREGVLARLPPARRAVAWLWTTAHRAMDQRAIRDCDRVIAISETVRDRARRYYGRDAAVIYPPVATSRFRFLEVGRAWLSVNRLYPEKRIGLQLEIFRRLPRERLVIVGGYSPGDRAERYVASLKPPPNVSFLGQLPEAELADLYGRCRGLLTTSIDEDFGIAPVEAMAAGKCVLATNEGGYRESVLNGETGYLLEPDAEAFAERMLSLDDDALRAMRPACEARARAFDESVFVDRFKEALGRIA